MDIKYNANKSEWVELDLATKSNPGGEPIEEWHLIQYRPFVESIENSIGRQLTKKELSTVFWLSGFEQNSINDIVSIINAAHEYGKSFKS